MFVTVIRNEKSKFKRRGFFKNGCRIPKLSRPVGTIFLVTVVTVVDEESGLVESKS